MKLEDEIRAHLPSTPKPKGWYVSDHLLEKAAIELESLRAALEMVLNTSRDPIKCPGMGSSLDARYNYALTVADEKLSNR